MSPEFEKEVNRRKQKTVKAAEVIQPAEERIAKIAKRDADTRAKYQRELARYVKTRGETAPCGRHPGEKKQINRDKCVDIRSQKEIDPERFTVFWQPCPKCAKEIQLKMDIARWVPHGIDRMFIGKKLEELIYETPEGQANLRTCQNYAEKPQGVLILLGGVGTGKTHAACSILQRQPDGRFITQSNLLSQRRKWYNDRTLPDMQERCMNCGLLVLDEVGVSVGGRDEESLLMDTLGDRYNKGRPTILTSNLDEGEFRRRIGERLFDRFQETLYALLHFKEKSRRAESNQKYFETLDLSGDV